MRRFIKWTGMLTAASVLLIGGYLGFLQLSGNFHEVVAGELYRSAQPSAAKLENYVRRHGIRTVINLRGENSDTRWYREEVDTARRLGIQHIDFRIDRKSTRLNSSH